MSLDAMNLERSTLERKDRTELATIAEALGRKPPSRAKKSEIVDLILELAGVTAGSSGTADPAGAGPSSQGDGPGDSTGAEDDGALLGTQRSFDDDPTDPVGGEASVPAGSTSDPAPVEGGDTRSSSDRDHANDRERNGGQGRGNQPRQGGNDANQQPANQQSGNQPANNQGAGGDGQGGDDGDGEGANKRRRRRRGRDRDRPAGEGGADVHNGGQSQGQGNDTPWEGEPVEVSGLLDLRDEGYGFLRVNGYLPSRDDVYVSVKQSRQLGLRKGDHVVGASRPAGRQEKNPALLRIDQVNGVEPDEARARPRFEDLTPLFPDEKLILESDTSHFDMTSRIVDLIAPIGKGQRGLIVSPPKAGKTTIMKTIAQAIERNNPGVELIVLLVDERPEEVTDMRRSVQGDVVASTFDRPSEEHTAIAELTIERAKRLVEMGRDVVIILDGITRLARAYNLAAPATGRIMSGGIDTGALYPPKKFFGAARNVEEGGSLTILATALVEAGSKMDEVIFEEFKGTGNMELRLDRRMAEKRVYPAIDVDASSTRHEELLFDPKELNEVWKLRRVLSGLASDGGSGASLELLIDRMRKFPTNKAFLAEIAKSG